MPMRSLLALLVLTLLGAPLSAQIGAATDSGDDGGGEARATPAADDGGEADAGSTDEALPNWERRITDARPGLLSATGLLRTWQATGMPVGHFGLSLFGEYLGGKNVVLDGDRVRRFAGHLGLSYTPIDHLEAFVQLSARSTTNTLGDPELIQSLGDLGLGLKGFGEVTDGLHLGGVLRFGLPAGANSVGLDGGAFQLTMAALLTADLRELADVPVRTHLNLAYLIDNGRKLFPEPLDRGDRFGHNVYDYNRLRVALGIDAPLKYVTPMLEWAVEVPNGADCASANPQPCVSEGGFSAYPQWLTLGLASAPLRSGLAFNTGIDLGLATQESQGTPAIPAWTWLFGLTYDLDPTPGRVVEVPVEVPAAEPVAPPTSFVRGTVTDSASGAPIAGARVHYADTEYSDQVTDDAGRFRSIDFPIGSEVIIEIVHPEYVTRALRMTIAETPREGAIALEQAFTGTRVTGRVLSRSGAAIEPALTLRGATTYEVEVGDDGAYQIDVEPGEYTIIAHAPGHVSEVQTLVLRSGREELEFSLTALPGGSGFRVTGAGIAWEGMAPGITFDGDELTDESASAVVQLAGLLRAQRGVTFTVRAHTDAQDDRDPLEEFDLTDARARARIAALVAQGVEASLLTAEGAGSSTPLFPNISDRNRRLNNRIEIVVNAP